MDEKEAILSGILFDPMAMSRVESDLKVEAFYLQSQQEIYWQQKPINFIGISS